MNTLDRSDGGVVSPAAHLLARPPSGLIELPHPHQPHSARHHGILLQVHMRKYGHRRSPSQVTTTIVSARCTFLDELHRYRAGIPLTWSIWKAGETE